MGFAWQSGARSGARQGLVLAFAGLASACALIAPAPKECPYNLEHVRPLLVTPYDQLAAFIGPDELEATLTKPLDESIDYGGGLEPAIRSSDNYVAEYRYILDHEEETRAEYRALGKDEAWIDLYLSSVRDGITINQAFGDAARCRKENLENS